MTEVVLALRTDYDSAIRGRVREVKPPFTRLAWAGSGKHSLHPVVDPIIWTQYSLDGETWSMELNTRIKAGTQGERLKRIVWLQQGSMRNWRIQRFRGTSDAQLSIARLEARLEPLAF